MIIQHHMSYTHWKLVCKTFFLAIAISNNDYDMIPQFDWSVLETVLVRGEWRCIIMVYGEQSVMTYGTLQMQMLVNKMQK